jgi:hypothetical protein
MQRSRAAALVLTVAIAALVAGCRPTFSTTTAHSATLPAVVGMRLNAAEVNLGKAGYQTIKPVDDTGRGRVVVDPENWIVAAQSPAAGTAASTGTTITLRVKRPSDGAGPTTVTKGVVPDVKCMNLQDAQDTLQKANFFNLASVDGLGQGRLQILDRDWVVTKQSVAAGTHAGPVTRIVLTAVKYGESTGSSGCQS